MVPEIGDPSIREVLVRSYRLLYGLDGDDVQFFAVRDSRQNLLPSLRK